MTSHKRKKSSVGWAKANWKDEYPFTSSNNAFMFLPVTYKTEDKRYNTKIRITIEEI